MVTSGLGCGGGLEDGGSDDEEALGSSEDEVSVNTPHAIPTRMDLGGELEGSVDVCDAVSGSDG